MDLKNYTLSLESCSGTQLTGSELTSGIDAAETSLAKSGANPIDARMHFELAANNLKHDSALADAWIFAEQAAIDSACRKWERMPEDLSLILDS